ncbi:MAG: adenylate/guanylate cyclase domain-containing protein [FCB group bacterium]|nr:adenylate/guanylate cyclase domain-containing protein [FCB group bacterium]
MINITKPTINQNSIKRALPILGITAAAFILSAGIYVAGFLRAPEAALYDYRFKLRGPLAGPGSRSAMSKKPEPFSDTNRNGRWDPGETFTDIGNQYRNENEPFEDCGIDTLCPDDPGYTAPDAGENNGIWEEGEPFTDRGNGIRDPGQAVVLVEIDDESYRLIPDPYPYGRGTVWSRVVRNLTDAGASVIAFDLLFDSPDPQTQNLLSNLKQFKNANLSRENVIDGDAEFFRAMQYAAAHGTAIILGAKRGYEANRASQPDYLVSPTPNLHFGDPTQALPYSIGIVDHADDFDGVSRKYLIFTTFSKNPEKLFYSFGLESVLRYMQIADSTEWRFDPVTKEFSLGSVKITTLQSENAFLLNYYGPPSGAFKTFNRYPLSDILDTEDYDLRAEDSDIMDLYVNYPGLKPFRNKIVLIGSSLPEDHDFVRSPYFRYRGVKQFTPGVEMHANAIQQILDDNEIRLPLGPLFFPTGSRLLQLGLILGFVVLTLTLTSTFKPVAGLIPVLFLVVGWLSFSIGSFTADYFWLFKTAVKTILPERFAGLLSVNVPSSGRSVMLPVVFPLVTIFISYGVNLAYKLISAHRDRQFLKDTFGTYISPDLIDRMYAEHQTPRLGGDEGYHTAFFSDIQDFSSLSEMLSPTDLVELLNEFLSAMTAILLKNKGTLDKYIGDAIVAFFGAPVKVENHEYAACLTALEMQQKLEVLRKKWRSQGDRWPEIVRNLRNRIGINSGRFVTGNMGSTQRLNYTMMGDAVNTASRLESSAKQYGVYIQVADKTYEAVKDDFTFRELDEVIVVGRKRPVRVYELISTKSDTPLLYQTLIPKFEEGLALYREQKWDAAISAFTITAGLEDMYPGRRTNPSRLYLERCREFKSNPPPENWNGVYRLTTK